MTTTPDLPDDCPKFMECPISQERMEDPVVAGDHHSYDRKFIQAWFDKGNTTSPLTRAVISQHLAPNQHLKTLIQEWVDDQLRGRADMQKLDALQAQIFRVTTSEEALSLVTQIRKLVNVSKFCLLPTSGVATLKDFITMKNLLTDEVSALLVVLSDQCRDAIKEKQTKHDQLNTKCLQLDTVNATMKEKQEGLQKTVAAMAKKVTLAEKKVPAARLIIQAYDAAKIEHDEAQTKLDDYNECVTAIKKVHRELSNAKEMIANELGNINSMNAEEESNSGGGSNSSSSSSSSFPVGSKRGRSSSSSSSSSSGTSKRQKKDDTSMAEHDFSDTFWVGQWLYEEGMAYWHGLKFKKKDKKRSRSMIEASASSGFPMAVAGCHYSGWNGMEQDLKKAFEMFVKIEQDTSGYHWVQCFLSECYQYGKGTDQDYTKAVESYTKSSEQENSVAMCHLGLCYEKGHGCDQNKTKAVELYEKSANSGNSGAMYNVGNCYNNGWGVTKDLNKAREWYTKAAAQGSADAQTQLDRLNASNN
jgi:TPR repeat protein